MVDNNNDLSVSAKSLKIRERLFAVFIGQHIKYIWIRIKNECISNVTTGEYINYEKFIALAEDIARDFLEIYNEF